MFEQGEANLATWLGVVVWLVGFGFETVGDWQLTRFRNDPASKGQVLDTGLWGWSRHPNYFFESLVWWAFFLCAVGSPWGWTTVVCPLLMLYFLFQVTGIPLTEEYAVKSKGEKYRAYKSAVPMILPLPKKQ